MGKQTKFFLGTNPQRKDSGIWIGSTKPVWVGQMVLDVEGKIHWQGSTYRVLPLSGQEVSEKEVKLATQWVKSLVIGGKL